MRSSNKNQLRRIVIYFKVASTSVVVNLLPQNPLGTAKKHIKSLKATSSGKKSKKVQ